MYWGFACLFVCIAFKGRNTKEQGKMREMELFIPWKLISTQEMPPDTLGDRSAVTALESQAATSRTQAERQHLAAYKVETLNKFRQKETCEDAFSYTFSL